MRKLDYLLNTSRGNYLSYLERKWRRLFFKIDQEPSQKKSMRESDKQRFQQELDAYLRRKKRGMFRGPVVLQMDFYPSKGNPPSIQHLAKNYIDLLYRRKSTPSLRLPMFDDRQVSILIVNYHIQRKNDVPHITLSMAPLGDFLKDLKLYQTLRNGGGFIEDDGNYEYNPRDLFEKNNREVEFEKSVESLENYLEYAKWGIPISNLEQIMRRNLQSAFLRYEEVSPADLAVLFYTNRYDDILDTIFNDHRKIIMSKPFSPLQPVGLPTQEGETKSFKGTIREMVNNYSDKYPELSPILVNLSLIILYVPPRDQEIDLDNLARHIVPIVNEALKPPAGFYFSQVPKQFPKHTFLQYQVIKLPRTAEDPVDGLASLILSEHKPFSNIWNEIDDLIDSWSDHVF